MLPSRQQSIDRIGHRGASRQTAEQYQCHHPAVGSDNKSHDPGNNQQGPESPADCPKGVVLGIASFNKERKPRQKGDYPSDFHHTLSLEISTVVTAHVN